jgi:hypothetical protein
VTILESPSSHSHLKKVVLMKAGKERLAMYICSYHKQRNQGKQQQNEGNNLFSNLVTLGHTSTYGQSLKIVLC